MHIIPDEDRPDPRVFIPNIEFYITNVCNLNCKNCNRFNDYNFSGTQLWEDYGEIYARWAKQVRLDKITVLGGEPLLNPTILQWIDGINQLWDRPVQVLTNGTRLNKVPGLYDRLLPSIEPKTRGLINWIGVSLHNPNDRERLFEEIKKFLKGPVTYHHCDDKDNVNNAITYGGTHAFIDTNGVKIPVWENTSFYQAALHRNAAGNLTLYNNDPNEAHRQCGFVMFKSYHFIRGKLYKCGPAALFPEFDQQYHLDISDQDRQLLNDYHALSIDDFDLRGAKFIADLDQVIPQCKFCPVKQWPDPLFAVSKKRHATSGFD